MKLEILYEIDESRYGRIPAFISAWTENYQANETRFAMDSSGAIWLNRLDVKDCHWIRLPPFPRYFQGVYAK